jgi:hypothetical protein
MRQRNASKSRKTASRDSRKGISRTKEIECFRAMSFANNY